MFRPKIEIWSHTQPSDQKPGVSLPNKIMLFLMVVVGGGGRQNSRIWIKEKNTC